MLVFISDLHLTDGRENSSLPTGAFELFAERLADMAVRASWRADGRYRPLDRIDVVLLGDTLDLIASRRWLEDATRPWHDPQSLPVTQCVGRLVDDVLQHNEPGLTILRNLTAPHGMVLPSVSAQGQPVWNVPGHPVRVRLHYLVGDHDWLLHLPGPGYTAIRQRVVERLGLANAAQQPFPHDACESSELSELMRQHRVLARHGDRFDPFHCGEDRAASSMGDALVVELLHRFAARVEAQYAHELPAAVLAGLRQADQIRPLLLVSHWIDGLFERACPSPTVRTAALRFWNELADEFMQLPLVRRHESLRPAELVDGLAAALKLGRRASSGSAARVTHWLNALRGTADGSYVNHALAEPDFRNRRARHIVYGHTHWPETVALDASFSDGFVLNQVYVNTGTWRRNFRPTQWASRGNEFIATEQLTFVAMYQGNERGGRPLEVWTGTLGLSGAERAVARIDAGPAEYVDAAQLSPSGVRIESPHFLRRVSTSPRRSAPRG